MDILADIKNVRNEFDERFSAVGADQPGIEQLRIEFLGRKGKIATLFAQLGSQDAADRPRIGKALNEIKNYVASALTEGLQPAASRNETSKLDMTLAGDDIPFGALHPVTQLAEQVKQIFLPLGFSVYYGPEVETDYYNFAALNFQPDHPARDMQDTFYIDDDVLLRTHTSNNQIHAMENLKPPFRILMPGRVFRNEAINARSHCQFHQLEGLVIGPNVSMAELKGTLVYFAKSLYGAGTRTRFRPSYFPFTEPSAEMDIYWGLETEQDYRITKGTGWLEILGCGMVHPNVLKSGNIDPDEFTGYAFGMGFERMAMLKWGIGDIRSFYEGDIRFLRQFR